MSEENRRLDQIEYFAEQIATSKFGEHLFDFTFFQRFRDDPQARKLLFTRYAQDCFDLATVIRDHCAAERAKLEKKPEPASAAERAAESRVVLAVFRNRDGKVLCTSDGLLGGKIKPGELPLAAAVRVAWEKARVEIRDASAIFARGSVVSFEATAWGKGEIGDGKFAHWGTWEEAEAGMCSVHVAKLCKWFR